MRHLPVRRPADVDRRAPRGGLIPATGTNTVPGSAGIPLLTIKVVDYAGKDPVDAAAQIWAEWTRNYPGAVIQIVHGDDWEALL